MNILKKNEHNKKYDKDDSSGGHDGDDDNKKKPNNYSDNNSNKGPHPTRPLKGRPTKREKKNDLLRFGNVELELQDILLY